MLLIMVGAPFPGRHLARDLIASVEDALQTPTLMITIIIKVIIISVIIMAYQHIPSGQNRTMVGFVTNSDDHHLHRHHHHDHNHGREFFWTLFVPPWPSEVFGPNKKNPHNLPDEKMIVPVSQKWNRFSGICCSMGRSEVTTDILRRISN